MKEKIKIIITDDQKIFRKGLVSLLERADMDVIAEAANGKELLKLLEGGKLRPDLILLDLDMPEMDGGVTLQKIRQGYPALKVIILSTFKEGSLINDFKAKGANSYLTKNAEIDVMIETIKRVHHLDDYSNLMEKAKSFFTKGEIQVIPLLLAGKTSKEAAESLGLATKTVEAYRNRLYDKTNTSNAFEFSSYCTREGLAFLGNIERVE